MAPSRGGQTSSSERAEGETLLNVNDPTRLVECARIQRQLGFQYLVRRYLSQILHGCTSPYCTTPTCLTCNKRLNSRPHRPPTQLTARALAHSLASQDAPYEGLCPHQLRVDPVSLAIEGADGVEYAEYGYGTTRPQLWCKTSPTSGLPLLTHAQRISRWVDERAKPVHHDKKDSVDPARVLISIDARRQAKKDIKSLGQNLYDTVTVIFSYSKQLPTVASAMETLQNPLALLQQRVKAQETDKARDRTIRSYVKMPALAPSLASNCSQKNVASHNEAHANTNLEVMNGVERIQRLRYRPSDNRLSHALGAIEDPTSFDGSLEVRTRRKSVKLPPSVTTGTKQPEAETTHPSPALSKGVSEASESTRQDESLTTVFSCLNATVLSALKGHVYKRRKKLDRSSVFSVDFGPNNELCPIYSRMSRSIFFYMSNAEALTRSFHDPGNPEYKDSPLSHLDSTQLSQAFRGWDRHNNALFFDSLWYAVQALFIPPPEIDNQKSPRVKTSQKGTSQHSPSDRPGLEHKTSSSTSDGYLSDMEAAHIVVICIHALTSMVSVAWPRTWRQLRHLRSWGIVVPSLIPNPERDSTNQPIDPWLDVIDELEYEPAIRLADALLRGLGARMCFERILATLGRKDRMSDDPPPSSTCTPLFDIVVNHLIAVEQAAMAKREEPKLNPRLNYDDDPGWTVTSTFMEWMRTIIVKKWDGKAVVNKWSSVGVSMALFHRFYAHWSQLNLRPHMFSIEWLNTQIDQTKEPINFLHWEPQPNSYHIFQFSCLFPAESMVSYFRVINFASMCKQYQHSEQISEMQRHLGTFITRPYLDAMNRRLKLSLSDYFVLQVGREHILKDTLNQLWGQEKRLLLKPLKVKLGTFDGEMGHDQGGVTYEFFRVVLEEAFKPDYGMFAVDPETNMAWFQPDSPEPGWKFEMLGMLFSLAVYNGVTLPVSFPLALYYHLLGPNHPDASKELEQTVPFIGDGWPTLAKSFDELLAWEDGDVADVFCRQYIYSYSAFGRTIDINLLPFGDNREGEEIPLVTNANRSRYVADYITLLTYTTVMPQLLTFRKGFYACLDPKSLHLFNAPALKNLVEGTQEVDVKAWQATTRYEDGYSPAHQTIKDFWSIVQDYDMEARRKLLEFVTASDRVPITGFESMNFQIVRNGSDTESLPTSSTCFGKLMLPEYATKEKLKKKLDVAIQYSKGFGVV